ncbi:methyltransferase domain-containing protein [Amycolatopsis sp. VS8301801F10]|uniref:methyltransferase domain-containing protein n=1 Tax=Amycolatopsis sp. VS8301801F10 TaxID=2652442 RepID=UPI0038FCFB12
MDDRPAAAAAAPHRLARGPADRLADYARMLRRAGAIRDDAVERAFATVPRHLFLARFRHQQWHEMPSEGPVPEEILDVVYGDNPLAFKIDEDSGQLVSATTRPSLLARILGALELSPGTRVLEIGAGIGYNAALIQAVTGAEVVSLDVQPDVIADAEEALRRCGVDGVVTVVGDGYDGHPARGPYDRILASCGIRGVPPSWGEQLAPGGFVLAPFAHGGAHPLVRFRRERGRLRATGVGPWTDFMLAGGALYQPFPGAHPARFAQGPFPEPIVSKQVLPRMTGDDYGDLWFFLAARSTRMTQAHFAGLDPADGTAALLAEDAAGAAVVQRGGAVHATGPDAAALADDLADLCSAWSACGRPAIGDWSAPMARHPLPGGPLLVPDGWSVPASRAGRRAAS